MSFSKNFFDKFLYLELSPAQPPAPKTQATLQGLVGMLFGRFHRPNNIPTRNFPTL